MLELHITLIFVRHTQRRAGGWKSLECCHRDACMGNCILCAADVRVTEKIKATSDTNLMYPMRYARLTLRHILSRVLIEKKKTENVVLPQATKYIYYQNTSMQETTRAVQRRKRYGLLFKVSSGLLLMSAILFRKPPK